MRVAIPETVGQVNPHFGQSTSFLVIDLDNNDIVSLRKVPTKGLQHRYDKVAKLLQKNQVDVVLVGSINEEGYDCLKSHGFLVISGVKGDVISAVMAYSRGELIGYEYNCSNKGKCCPA